MSIFSICEFVKIAYFTAHLHECMRKSMHKTWFSFFYFLGGCYAI